MDTHEARCRTWAPPLGLALVAIALYAPLIGWGAPRATAPNRVKTFATDEILPLEALAEMRNTFVVSRPDRNYGYPWWHYFVVAVAQTPYLAYLKLSGELQAPSPEYPFGLRDPVQALRWLTVIGRMVSVLMGAGVVVAAYIAAPVTLTRRLFSGAASVWRSSPTRTVAGTINLFGDYLRKLAEMASPPLLLTAVAGALLGLRSKPRLLILLLPVAALFVIPICPPVRIFARRDHLNRAKAQ